MLLRVNIHAKDDMLLDIIKCEMMSCHRREQLHILLFIPRTICWDSIIELRARVEGSTTGLVPSTQMQLSD